MTRVSADILHQPSPSLIRSLSKLMQSMGSVMVGVPSTADARKGTNTATIAAVHEYGGGHVPERPWLRNTIRNNLQKYKRFNRINAVKVLRSKISAPIALELLGQMAKSDVQEFIYTNNYTLAPATVKRKQRNRAKGGGGENAKATQALVDTGAFAQSINYVLDAI